MRLIKVVKIFQNELIDLNTFVESPQYQDLLSHLPRSETWEEGCQAARIRPQWAGITGARQMREWIKLPLV